MAFKCIFAGCCSACFELENSSPYRADKPYSVKLDGVTVLKEKRENVFSLFGLSAGTEHTVQLSDGSSHVFRTKPQSAALDVRTFGARGDGVTDDTNAIQAAVFACSENGKITVPAGEYRIRPLVLKSFITLELQKGAKLLASSDTQDYPVWPALAGKADDGSDVICSAWEGRPRACHQSVLSAHFAREIFIVGEGVIDGGASGSQWWVEPKKREAGRPRILFLNGCSECALHGVTVCSSPSWNLHPYRSKNIAFYDITVNAPADSPNTDGCDPESCDGVDIIGARFSVGDDAIAIKSGKAEGSNTAFPKAARHTIRNCLMQSAHGAVVLGSELSGGIEELSVSQCLFIDTDRGLRIKTRRGRGRFAEVDGVRFENIAMRGVKTPFVINMFYFCDEDGKSEYVQSKMALPVDDRTPYLGRFTFKDIVCEDCQSAAGWFYGLPERPIESVELDNVSIRFSKAPAPFVPAMMIGCGERAGQGLFFYNVSFVRLKNVAVENLLGERLTLDENVMLTED